MKLEQHFCHLCRSAGNSTEHLLHCGQHHALPCALSCAPCCLNTSCLLAVLEAVASAGLPMKHELGFVPQLSSSFLPCVSWVRHICLAHCAILENTPGCRNVEKCPFIYSPASPCSQFPVYCKTQKITSPQHSSSSWEILSLYSRSFIEGEAGRKTFLLLCCTKVFFQTVWHFKTHLCIFIS